MTLNQITISGIEFVLVSPGSFVMGSRNGNQDESPQHEVVITKPFYLGKYPVTQEQWEGVMGENYNCLFTRKDIPVARISWNDAQAFCKRLGAGFRLPTEAEWEYACLAGTKTKYFFGDEEKDLKEYAWCGRNSRDKTHPVGLKKPNPWSLYDMVGNVFEWCSDFHGPYSSERQVDPQGPSSGSFRVSRGGCWNSSAWFCRSALRNWFDPGFRSNVLGLRLVFAPELEMALLKSSLKNP